MSRKGDTKGLKGPDQFQVKAMESVTWMSKHGREITIVVVLAAIVVGGISGYQWYESTRRESRLEELGKIEVTFNEEEQAAEEKREALRTQIADIDAQIAAAKSPEGEAGDTKALEEQKAQLEEQVASIEADHAGTMDQYAEFFRSYKSKPEGWAAGMHAVELYLTANKMDQAADLLKEIIAHTDHDVYKIQARLVLASVYEDKEQYDDGLTLVDEALGMAKDDESLAPQILFAKGRLYYFKKENDQARGVFDQIVKEYATSAEADKARSMKFLLN